MAFSVSGGNAQFPFEQTERRPGPLEAFRAYTMIFTKAALIMLSIAILVRCIRSMLRERYEPETWAYLRSKQGTLPVTHWENLIGRSRSVDLRLNLEKISRVHAVLIRSERGNWHVYDVFSKGGIWVNGARVGAAGLPVHDGDILNLAGNRSGAAQAGEAGGIPQLGRTHFARHHAAGAESVPALSAASACAERSPAAPRGNRPRLCLAPGAGMDGI